MQRIILLVLLAFRSLLAAAQTPDSLWKAVPVHFDAEPGALYSDLATGDLYIANPHGKVNGQEFGIVKWDGLQSTLLQPSPELANNLVCHRGKLIAISQRYNPKTPYTLSRFDGQSWTTLDSFELGKEPWFITTMDSDVVLTGVFESIAGHPIKMAALWDGGNGWRDMYRMDTFFHWQPFINSVLKYKGETYVAGNIQESKTISHIARFDGTHWTDVGGGIPGPGFVSSMVVWKNELYVAGDFFEREGAPGNCIARWDGQNWHPLGSGVLMGTGEAAIYDMAVYHDKLYVVGTFGEAGGVRVENIARWDGSRWCSMNTTFNSGTPSQIEVAKDEMYISGSLWTINRVNVSNLARWIGEEHVENCGRADPTEVIAIASSADRSFIYPNPASNRLQCSRSDIQSIDIFDVTGTLIKSVSKSEVNSGIDISEWPAGFYIAIGRLENRVTIREKILKH
jgi:hypothetical protein